jgi:hypothetical protein
VAETQRIDTARIAREEEEREKRESRKKMHEDKKAKRL